MAGLAAVANAQAGTPLGFLNPLIYGVYTKSPASLYDVDLSTVKPTPAVVRVNFANSENASGGLTYSVRTQETTATTLHTKAGYDTGSGVGTPKGDAFLTALVGAAG
jgi:hypothetical protein